MAISPEVRPRGSAASAYEVPPIKSTATERREDRMEEKSDKSIGYVLAVLTLIVVGYFAYLYFGQGTMTPSITDQSTTTIVPPVAPPVVAPAPLATAPAAPAVPATPAAPPATTTTP